MVIILLPENLWRTCGNFLLFHLPIVLSCLSDMLAILFFFRGAACVTFSFLTGRELSLDHETLLKRQELNVKESDDDLF